MIIPAGYAQINHYIGGTAYPRHAEVTYGVLLVGTPSPSDIAFAAHALFAVQWPTLWPNTTELLKTRAKFGPTETGPFADYENTTVGSRATAPDSPQVTVLVTKQTELGGRKNRGRLFMPGVAEADTNAGGMLGAGERSDLQGVADAWLDSLAGGAFIDAMYLLHNDPLVAPTQVTSLAVAQLVATQRRRLRKVGGRRRTF